MEQVGEHVDAAVMDVGRLGIFVLIDVVLAQAVGEQPVGLRLHPGRHESGQVEGRIAVEVELVANDPVCDIGRHHLLGQLVPRDRRGHVPGAVRGR
jgi:hypothetical protein